MIRNSRSLLNVGMIIFLAVFISVFYYSQNTEESIPRLSTLTLNEITNIRISRTDGNDILFIKESDDIWYMIKPYYLKAHQFRIKTLLSLTQATVTKKYDIKTLDLSQYALDKPRAQITFNNTEIRFGKTNPLNNMRYFLAEGKMTLLSDQVYPLVSAQASSFIDLSLLPENFSLTKIQTPATSILLNNENKWVNADNEAKHDHLNADQVQTLLQHWNSAQAFAVHRYMPRKQLGQIEVSSQTKTLIFQITDDDPWLILALPDLNIEYHLDSSQKNNLLGIVPSENDDA